MNSELKSHLLAKSTWLRLLYMILFVIAFNVAELITGVVVVVQFLFKLFAGQANEQLQGFGHSLAVYFRQIVGFLTYDTEDMPYPFAPWPNGGAEPARPAAQAAPEPPAAGPAPEPPAEPEPEPPTAEPKPPVAAAEPAARPKPKTGKPKRPRKKPADESKR